MDVKRIRAAISGPCSPAIAAKIGEVLTGKKLPDREKVVLATEIVNGTLKTLTGAVKDGTPATPATAECARHAFACLRRLEAGDLQVETGMSALIGRLLSLEMDDLALKELRILNQRLLEKLGLTTKVQTLSDLVRYDPAPASDALAALVSAAQLHAVTLACRSPKSTPGVCEMQPFHWLRGPKSASTAASMSKILLEAKAGPETTFRLTVLALRLRVYWGKLAGKDMQRYAAEAFAKAITGKKADLLVEGYNSLEIEWVDRPGHVVHKALALATNDPSWLKPAEGVREISNNVCRAIISARKGGNPTISLVIEKASRSELADLAEDVKLLAETGKSVMTCVDFLARIGDVPLELVLSLAKTEEFESIDRALQACLPARVQVSNAYWSIFLRSNQKKALRRSVDALDGASPEEEKAGHLATKLERLAGLSSDPVPLLRRAIALLLEGLDKATPFEKLWQGPLARCLTELVRKGEIYDGDAAVLEFQLVQGADVFPVFNDIRALRVATVLAWRRKPAEAKFKPGLLKAYEPFYRAHHELVKAWVAYEPAKIKAALAKVKAPIDSTLLGGQLREMAQKLHADYYDDLAIDVLKLAIKLDLAPQSELAAIAIRAGRLLEVPKDPLLHAEYLLKTGEYAKGLQLITEDTPQAYILYSRLHFAAGSLEPALAAAKYSVKTLHRGWTAETAPALLEAMHHLIAIFLHTGHQQEAKYYAEQAEKIPASPRLAMQRTILEMQRRIMAGESETPELKGPPSLDLAKALELKADMLDPEAAMAALDEADAILQELGHDLLVEKRANLQSLRGLDAKFPGPSLARVRHQLRLALELMSRDAVYCVVQESTLSCPSAEPRKKKTKFAQLLRSALDDLSMQRRESTHEFRMASALLADILLLLSLHDTVQSRQVASALEMVNIVSMQRERMLRVTGKPKMVPLQEETVDFREIVDAIPSEWNVVSLSLGRNRDEILVSRLRPNEPPFVLRLPLTRHEDDTLSYEDAMAELEAVVSAANATSSNAKNVTTKKAKAAWWAEREALDERLRALLENIENLWLGGFKGIFDSAVHTNLGKIKKSLQLLLKKHLPSRRKGSGVEFDGRILELFASLPPEEDAVTDIVYFIVDVLQFHGEANAYDEIDFDALVVDCTALLRAYTAPQRERHTILVLDKGLHAIPWESLPCLEGRPVSRVTSLSSIRRPPPVLRKGTFVLNPTGDLAGTQKLFEPKLAKLGWKSITGREPTEDEMKAALEGEIFIYFGHGSGAQFIRGRTIKSLDKCAVSLLLGCSSGKLSEIGNFEAFGTPINYLQANCPALVATLWDVTDKDIDRFSDHMLDAWLFGSDSLVEAVAKSRSACNLRYLNGAAPVVYGVPVSVTEETPRQ